MRTLHLVAWIVWVALALTAAQSSPNQDDVTVRRFLQRFDADLKDQYIAAFADLNDDGKMEAIIHLTSTDWCGTGGCTTLVLVRDGDSWRVLTKISITRPPIRVLKTKSNGWHSIGVWAGGGGIQPGYEAELPFNGKTYPSNPSVAPARRVVGRPDGEVAIPSSTQR
jgi:hypothetical protein